PERSNGRGERRVFGIRQGTSSIDERVRWFAEVARDGDALPPCQLELRRNERERVIGWPTRRGVAVTHLPSAARGRYELLCIGWKDLDGSLCRCVHGSLRFTRRVRRRVTTTIRVWVFARGVGIITMTRCRDQKGQRECVAKTELHGADRAK